MLNKGLASRVLIERKGVETLIVYTVITLAITKETVLGSFVRQVDLNRLRQHHAFAFEIEMRISPVYGIGLGLVERKNPTWATLDTSSCHGCF